MRILFLGVVLLFLYSFSYAQIRSSVDSIEEVLRVAPNDTNKINLLTTLSRNIENADQNKSVEYGREALKLSQSIHYSKGIASSLNCIGRGYKLLGTYDSALFYFKKALAVEVIPHDPHMHAGTFLNIGAVFKSQSIYDSAAIYYHHALDIAEHANDLDIQGSCLNNLGNILKEQRDIEGALKYFEQALDIRIQQKNQKGIANTSLNIGICYDLGQEHTKAQEYFTKALSIYTALNDRSGMAKCNNNFAQSLQLQRKFNNALPFLNKAMELQKELGDRDGIASTTYSLALLNNILHKIDEALKYGNESLSLAAEVGDQQLVLKNYELLQNVSIARNDFKQAYEYANKASHLRDSIFNENKTQIIGELQTKYETEKKEQHIKILDQENKNKALERDVLLVGSVALLVALIAIVLMFMQRQRIARQRSQIKDQQIEELLKTQEISVYNAMIDGQEAERKRIAVDLHDRLGSMLSTVKAYFSSVVSESNEGGLPNMQLHEEATILLDTTCDELRKIANNLSTGLIATEGLCNALEELCDTIERGSSIKCKVLVYHFNERIDNQMEIAIYRIAQELLSNILKHARAKNVTLQLNKIDNILQVTLEDDGLGYDFNERIKSPGMGLKNILSRVERLHGKFHVDSIPGKGSFAFLEIPLPHNHLYHIEQN